MKKIFLLILLLITCHFSLVTISADEVGDLQKQIDQYNKDLELSKKATTPLEGQLESLRRQLTQIQANLDTLSANIAKKQRELDSREDKLAELTVVFDSRVVEDYKNGYIYNPLGSLFGSSSELSDKLYHLKTISKNREIIKAVSADIVDLLNQKEKLEKDKQSLALLQSQVDKNATFLGGEVSKAKAYQLELSGKIAELSAKQQAILSAKSGTFTTSVGDVPLADDPKASPNYNPGFSPAFAGFSFGAFTHKNGMSQYGAKGRAESGQSAEQILAHYYPGATLNKNYSVPATINVTGYGTRAFEDEYMKRIYEMPNSFPKEALKAQAVAARTYAVRQGGSICATESCQVFKDTNKGGAWEEAVNETRGWVLEGGPNSQYSSTTGGYLNNSGWDTTSGTKDTWTGGAYEKIAGSPWFYKGWYTESYAISSATCGRSHPWLNSEEMADILNAWVVLIDKGQSDDRVTPIGSCWGGNPYSLSELRSKASSLGGAFSSVSSVSVTYSNSGSTASVSFQTDKGSISINGVDFKKAFNLRAPGYLSIKSALFNIEKK